MERPSTVRKRDGSVVQFDQSKITAAMGKAFHDRRRVDEWLGARDRLTVEVVGEVSLHESPVHIELIQDVVEKKLMASGFHDVAKAYVLYRQKRAETRRRRGTPDPRALQEYIHAAKYAGVTGEGRLETFEQTVARVEAMHVRRYGRRVVGDAFDHVRSRRVLPAMRSLQFGGNAIERNNVRMYNCAFTLVDRMRVFGEIFYVLLCGSGVGFSVQWYHVGRLPELKRIDDSRVRHYHVPDSIEGWAEAVNELMRSHFVDGDRIEFDYSGIRSEGSPLTTGGLAPGHLPLKASLEAVRAILEGAAYRQLRPIECYDIVCHLALAVLSGGIRRSSLICLFSPDDSEMVFAKAHGNFQPAGSRDWRGRPIPAKNDQRQMANNSAVFHRNTADIDAFDRVVRTSKQWGDPGVFWTSDTDHGCNPCGEIGLDPKLVRGREVEDRTLDFRPYQPRDPVLAAITSDMPRYSRFLKNDIAWYSDESPAVRMNLGVERFEKRPVSSNEDAVAVYGSTTGFQFCNLVEVNVAACRDRAEFVDACAAASRIATMQAGYTEMPYLGPVTEKVVERDALIGVGLTGIASNPGVGLDPELLRLGAGTVVTHNEIAAAMIGVNPAKRCTCVKPSGTASLALGSVGHGIHPHHARRYFRRVTARPSEPAAVAYREANPDAVEVKPNGDLSITFPVQAPDGAVVAKDWSTAEFMQRVFSVYENWVLPGTREGNLTHNVSCTVTVDGADEWRIAAMRLWEKRESTAAMSFAPATLDKAFPFAPQEAVSTPADEARWERLTSSYKPVDWSKVSAAGWSIAQDPACAGRDTCAV
jgi:ribonucleoside-diphosphate reductase alpha chain